MLSKRGMLRESEGRGMYEKRRKRNYRIQRMLLHNIRKYHLETEVKRNSFRYCLRLKIRLKGKFRK